MGFSRINFKRFLGNISLCLNIWCNKAETFIEQISCILGIARKESLSSIILGISESTL